jgi:hypothetical protein
MRMMCHLSGSHSDAGLARLVIRLFLASRYLPLTFGRSRHTTAIYFLRGTRRILLYVPTLTKVLAGNGGEKVLKETRPPYVSFCVDGNLGG